MKYSEIPPFVTVSKAGKVYYYTINFVVEQVEDEYEVESATLAIDHKLTEDDYGPLVSAIIRSRFSPDDVEAVQLNYMESKTTGHKKDWASLKAWRALAKEKAQEAIAYVATLSAK